SATKNSLERVIGGIERRVLNLYARSLWFFLRQRCVSALVWLGCLAGTGYLFYVVPKAFLPIGDSSFVRGVFVAQEGSSPGQMHAYQLQSEEALHSNPAVDVTFTMGGTNTFFSMNQGLLLAILKDPDQRPSILAVAAQIMWAVNSRVPEFM